MPWYQPWTPTRSNTSWIPTVTATTWSSPTTYVVNNVWFRATNSTSATNTVWYGNQVNNCGLYNWTSDTVDVQAQQVIEALQQQRDFERMPAPAIIHRKVPPTPALQRAEALLYQYLTRAQRRTLRQYGWIIVQGGKSGRRYRINCANDNLVGNIAVLTQDNRVDHRLCCHVRRGAVPTPDQWLAQKLMLEVDEEAFLRLANRHAA